MLVDTNLLVYAHLVSVAEHAAARQWLDAQLSGTARVGLPWQALLGFLRLVTNPRMFPHPEPMELAWAQVSEWLSSDVVWTPEPGARHADILAPLLRLPGIHGNLVPDAHLAALAIEHGLTLCSNDGDFARFPGLRRMNPLAA